MSNEEEKLKEWKDKLDQAEVSEEQMNSAIQNGFERAKNETFIAKRYKKKRMIWSSVVVTLLVISFVTSIRVSPTFAQAVAAIPGMEAVVDFIREDQTIYTAIENDYFDPLDIVVEQEGVTVTLHGSIVDEEEMVLLYSIDGIDTNQIDYHDFPKIRTMNHQEIEGAATIIPNYEENDTVVFEKLNIRFDEEIKEQDFILDMAIKKDGKEILFKIPFQIKHKKLPTEVFELNKEVDIEQQKLIIHKVEISPLKVAVHIEENEHNTKKIFTIEDLALLNETGEKWTSIQNGLSSIGTDNELYTIYLMESNYFDRPEKLTLSFSTVMALDKDDVNIVLDTDNEKIIKQPADNRFSHLKVNGKYLELELRADETYYSSPLMRFTDSLGKELSVTSSMFSRPAPNKIILTPELEDIEYESPITVELSAYPNYIQGDVKIELK